MLPLVLHRSSTNNLERAEICTMLGTVVCFLLSIALHTIGTNAFYTTRDFECGPYGFICDEKNRVRLCDGFALKGPAFNCPQNSICNEESTAVCEASINYIDPVITKNLRCHRNERIADLSVPGCKGYILCISNKNRFQGIKFKCSGNTIFSGYTRTCTMPQKYKCPMENNTRTTFSNDVITSKLHDVSANPQLFRPIDCKNYKLQVTQDNNPTQAAYFCPSKPAFGESRIRCTIFSNNFCVTLERDIQDQFLESAGAAYRKPRKQLIA